MRSRVTRGWMRAAVVLLLPMVAGCFTYTRTSLDQVAAGAKVRVEVQPDAAARLTHALGYPADELRGEALSTEGDSLLLQVAGAMEPGGVPVDFSQRVRISAAGMREIDVQRVDWTRTGVVMAAAAVAGGIVIGSIFNTTQRNSQNVGKPNPNAVRIPVIRLPMRP